MINKKITKKIEELKVLLEKEGYYVETFSPEVSTTSKGCGAYMYVGDVTYQWKEDIKLNITFDLYKLSQPLE